MWRLYKERIRFAIVYAINRFGMEINVKETVLYYAPESAAYTALLKGVLVQMGIKIKNLTPGRCEKKIGFLAGVDGFNDEASMLEGGQQVFHAVLREEFMVFCGFTEERLDELLDKLKKVGIPKTIIKAVLTETNAHWTIHELYDHLMEERRKFEQR